MTSLKLNNKKSFQKFFAVSLTFVFLFFCFFVFLSVAHAQYGLEETVEQTPIAKSSIPEFVGTIIKYVIGILGVILVALIIYGGITYATAAGNEERAKTGKSILTYAVIGVTICALAFAISDYVLRTLLNEKLSFSEYGSGLPEDRFENAYIKTAPYHQGDYCGKMYDGCWYRYTCCPGYKCKKLKGGTWNPFDNRPPGECVREEEWK